MKWTLVLISIYGWTKNPCRSIDLVATLTELCESEKLNYRVMHSGAGHDAQIFAPHVPTCMIFIPSINGISHNPAERADITDLAEGVKTLALMLYQLAWQK